MKFIIPSSILIFILMLISANSYAQSAEAAIKTSQGKVITVKVKGVGCSKDIKSIADSVKKLDGVKSCEVAKKGATTTYDVAYDPAMVTRQQVEDAIEDTPGCKNPNDRPYKVKQ